MNTILYEIIVLLFLLHTVTSAKCTIRRWYGCSPETKKVEDLRLTKLKNSLSELLSLYEAKKATGAENDLTVLKNHIEQEVNQKERPNNVFTSKQFMSTLSNNENNDIYDSLRTIREDLDIEILELIDEILRKLTS